MLLARLYKFGRGVPKNTIEALKWNLLSFESDPSMTKMILEKAKESMTANSISGIIFIFSSESAVKTNFSS